jgi:hypothetical protein
VARDLRDYRSVMLPVGHAAMQLSKMAADLTEV